VGRGFISGILWGTAIGCFLTVIVSQLADLPPGVAGAPQAREVEVPAGSEFDQAKPETEPVVPQTENVEDIATGPSLSPPLVEEDRSAPSLEQESVAAPSEVSSPQASLTVPEEGASETGVSVEPDNVANQPTVSAVPVTPAETAVPNVSNESSEPPSVTQVEEEIDQATVPAPEVQEAAIPQIEEPSVSEDAASQPTDLQEGEDIAVVQPEISEEPAPEIAEPQTPEVSEAPTVVDPPVIRMPVPEISDLAPNVTTNRLPRIGEDADNTDETASEATEELPKSALEANSIPFENPDNKPLFSIILIDDGNEGIDADLAARLPFPISFAVDGALPDAGARSARYREAGFEVMLYLRLPEGATNSDVEIVLQSALSALPDAVAVFDAGQIGSDRNRAQQVAQILAESGHGLVALSKGLNAIEQVAARNEVPVALAFREFDSNRESGPVIRRYMDRAAFRAQQEGSVIMVGHLYSDSISGLLSWGLEDKAANMAIAPISAILKSQS